MGTLFTAENGRLKIGRVTVVIFLGILCFAALLFKAAKPIDQAVVAVKHVFEPNIAKHYYPEKQDNNEIPEEENEIQVSRTNLSDFEPAPPATLQIPLPADQDKKSGNITAKDEQELVRQEIKPVGEEQVVVQVEKKDEYSGEDLIVSDTQQEGGLKTALLIEKMKNNSAANFKPVRLDISDSISWLLHQDKAKKKQPEKKDTESSSQVSYKITSVDHEKSTVTVEQQQYMQLFKDWRESGTTLQSTDQDIQKKISLRVENLRQVYDLFQMKPVALTRGVFIDLETNTRIPKEALEQYSNTVFSVSDPWGKWNNALQAAGVKRTDTVDVRYYMYTFVRNAIYARAEKAFEWSHEQGLTEREISPADVDILGKAFVVSQNGGGRFGVFVPFMLTMKDGKTLRINPACFQGERDVDTLVIAGLL